MAETKTADQLIYEAAAILGKNVAGEALGQPEYDAINNNVDDVLSEISTIVAIGDRDEIPVRLFMTIARLLAIHSAAKFSNTPPDMAQVLVHEQRLRELVGQGPSYETLKTNYF